MTIEETLRAAVHVLEALQMDTLRRLQNGHLTGPVAMSKLETVDRVRVEVREIQSAADHSPELYTAFATAGGSANQPSLN